MKILITGVCGFVGSRVALWMRSNFPEWTISGVDNLSRSGSELNRSKLIERGIEFRYADIRVANDVRAMPDVDWVIDAAAIPSVLAGTDGSDSFNLMQNNLFGTVHLLEYCRSRGAGFIMLSTSRVYAIEPLADLPLSKQAGAFIPDFEKIELNGFSELGLAESFSTETPVSLYGASKIASERLALEYSNAYQFPVRINRCGVLAGAGQFGQAAQGIFAYWIHSHQQQRPLKYLGFDGDGAQVRDVLHPKDLAQLLAMQIQAGNDPDKPAVVNVSGGRQSATSLAQLTDWCDDRFGVHAVRHDASPRPYDLPWVVLNSSIAESSWNWTRNWSNTEIFTEIADFAEQNRHWLDWTR